MVSRRPKPVILAILDGFGIAPPSKGNGVTLAKKPVFDYLVATYPVMTLQASGEAVGLSWGEMGNSEVGHINLGSGKIVYQTLPRLNKSIENGSFFENKVLLKAVNQTKKNKSRLHLLGLVSNGGVHSHQNHLYALLDLCKKQGLTEIYIHAILDGRDTKKDGGLDFINQLLAKINEVKVGKIASISGRYYAMDRDNHWDREEKAFNAIAAGKSPVKAEDPKKAISQSYQNNIFDEEFLPMVMTEGGKPVATIEDSDAVIFFNFRADRGRQLTATFSVPSFNKFKRAKNYRNLFFATMTQYDKDLPVEVAFPPETIDQPLAKIIQDNNLTQLHVAETEKYAHVTFFFNGGKEDPFKGEDRILVPSPPVPSYDQKPEMSALEINTRLLPKIKEGKYDFVVINYANPDMVGHTGVIPATIKAVETVDKCLGELVNAVLGQGGICFVTADHGNAEELINLQTGEVDKEHSTNPVPFVIVGADWEGKSLTPGLDSVAGDLSILTPSGMLADIAPTILKVLGVPKPDEMTGAPLI
ncbi:MAG: phosphoglycerate mutase (2,3-diphosphoglycerate-independent) [Candidatus Buchananbacteria bacterium RIFCSPHIGHO2_01_FULL_39_14]|uniref:2,3-bisphosphoglycerate-independent phosphoglycerate mutase n=1 Tax=Candidatus Buchananbacteria bacterium RIFCSPHIGHO2_01_FULL_39_14 TaxID=1797532 RepID=A0A1G1XX19_9BACT|nr:MAG: phosphoglycerate mutase (2,3-diphosphoglycerate-independent) [Candidatus Buchananbacteria bacterium RIFCSPHIGHO2_01_FULL_39_14]